jgi:hypothetical protein
VQYLNIDFLLISLKAPMEYVVHRMILQFQRRKKKPVQRRGSSRSPVSKITKLEQSRGVPLLRKKGEVEKEQGMMQGRQTSVENQVKRQRVKPGEVEMR